MRGWGAYFMGGDNGKQWNERGLVERVLIRDRYFVTVTLYKLLGVFESLFLYCYNENEEFP